MPGRQEGRGSAAKPLLVLAAVQIPALDWEEALLRIALAAVFGAAIGIEREIREREAGLRTHMLVSVGSCLFTITSAYGFHEFLVNGGAVIRADPTRIAAQIVTGIGFLGAGSIIRQGLAIRGLTTAATLWVVAAIGLAAGAGYYSAALITTLVVLFSLWPLRILAHRVLERPHERRLSVQLGPEGTPSGIVETLERLGIHVEQFEVQEEEGMRMIELRVDLPRGVLPELVIRRLLMVEQVRLARWGQ